LSSGRPAWPLASPLLYGVRTFLSPSLPQQLTGLASITAETALTSDRPTNPAHKVILSQLKI